MLTKEFKRSIIPGSLSQIIHCIHIHSSTDQLPASALFGGFYSPN